MRLVTGGRRPQGSMPMRVRALARRHAWSATQELDPSLGAGFEPGEQELSGRRVEFRMKLKAGEHWIAGTPLRLYEGLPPSFEGPAPSTLPPPPKPEFKPRPGMTPEQIEFAKKRFEARLTERRWSTRRASAASRSSGRTATTAGRRPRARRASSPAATPGRTSPRAGCRSCRGWRGGPTAGRWRRPRSRASCRWPSASRARRARSRKAWRRRCRPSSCRRTSCSASSAASRGSRRRGAGRRSASA